MGGLGVGGMGYESSKDPKHPKQPRTAGNMSEPGLCNSNVGSQKFELMS